MNTTFTIPAANLSAALSLLSVAMERKTTIPVLSYVLIKSGDGIEASALTIKLTATDLDCLVSTTITPSLPINEPFAICLPLREVLELVKLLDGDVAITLDGGWAWVKSGATKQKFPTIAADKFPAIEPATNIIATLPGPLLASMIAAAMIAAETNPDGEGKWKCLEVAAKAGTLEITGGTNARIASTSTPCEAEFYALLPLRSATILASFAESTDTVTLALSSNLLTAKSDKGEASLKLSALKWPDWKMLIASSYPHEVTIDFESFIPALRRTILALDKQNVQVDFQLTSTAMTIAAQGRDRESHEELAIDCPSFNGDSFSTGVNGAQLLDFFKVCKGNAVWHVPDGVAQLFTPTEPLPFGFRYVQARMRVKDA